MVRDGRPKVQSRKDGLSILVLATTRVSTAALVTVLLAFLSPVRALASRGSARRKPVSISGWISDSACGAAHARPGGADCVRKCIAGGASIGHPEWKPQKMVLVDDSKGDIWTVENPDALKGDEGLHVKVTGILRAKARTVRIRKVRRLES
ncbi:MAG TPA: hypothetical protein VEZ90_18305 [Blastocatellia bacterium]|nr:hypothetical protein [Blastocatellia bacterium]